MSHSAPPPWSTHSIPFRGAVVRLEQSFSQILAAELAVIDRQRRNILAGELEKSARQTMLGLLSQQDLPSDAAESESSSEDEFTPRPSRYSTEYREFQLRPRPPRIPLADITPIPDLLVPADLHILGFRQMNWNEPGISADLQDRVGAVFIGPPADHARWEKTILEANRIMRVAQAHLDRAALEDDSIRSGITYDPTLKVS
ncbi:hypothetical protein DFH06DRAFT_1127028 [Mycena polygramma]|nr:hypothetical protein DFH06DRAFT_1127028 [Mycena polygramma]